MWYVLFVSGYLDRSGEEYLALGDSEVRDWLCPSIPYPTDIRPPSLLHYPTFHHQLRSYTTVYYCLLLSSSPDTADNHSSILSSYSTVLDAQYIHSLPGLFANNLIGLLFLLP